MRRGRSGASWWRIATPAKRCYALNADHFFAPASNAKVFATALALATLGRDYQFRTTLESHGSLGSDGRLAGDLVLTGRGDPDLSNRKFPYSAKMEREGPTEKVLAEMADAAVAKGLREVDGDIVADDSYFPYDPYPAGWNAGDLFFEFGAPVSAIAFNDNTVSIEVQPGGRVGDPATITTEPRAALDTFGYEITTVAAGESPNFAVVRQPGPNFLLLRGTIAMEHVAHQARSRHDGAERNCRAHAQAVARGTRRACNRWNPGAAFAATAERGLRRADHSRPVSSAARFQCAGFRGASLSAASRNCARHE